MLDHNFEIHFRSFELRNLSYWRRLALDITSHIFERDQREIPHKSLENSSPGVFRNNEKRLGMKVPKGSPPTAARSFTFSDFILFIYFLYFFFQCDHENCNNFSKEIFFFSILFCEPLIMITSLALEEFELSYTPGRKCEKIVVQFFFPNLSSG